MVLHLRLPGWRPKSQGCNSLSRGTIQNISDAQPQYWKPHSNVASGVARLLLLLLLASFFYRCLPPSFTVARRTSSQARRYFFMQTIYPAVQPSDASQFQLGLERADHGNEILTRSTHNMKHIQKDASLDAS